MTSAEVWPDVDVDHELKYAYVQIGPNTIMVSPHNAVREFDEDEMMWVDRTGPAAYGDYWLVLEKQQ